MTQTLLPLVAPVSYAQSDYIVTDSNRALYDSVLQPDKWNSYGCLLIGEKGSGKTHLAHIWKDHFHAHHAEAKTIVDGQYSPDKFLVVENIEAAKPEVLFHLLNVVKSSGQKILLTASEEPKSFMRLPDALSRLNALFVLHIPQPDEALLEALLRKFFADRQLRVESDVIKFILVRCERSYRALDNLVQRLDDSSLIKKQGVTIPLVKQVLES